MKRTKFSEVQITFVLKQAEDRMPVGEVSRKARDQRGDVLFQLAANKALAEAAMRSPQASLSRHFPGMACAP